jgi:uncharacterized damage-inducible protein DinB
MMRYDFLVDTYRTERLKTVSVWSMFEDGDLDVRPHPTDRRGRSVREQMIHQCVSEDLWFRNMLGIDVGAPPLPDEETRLEFIRRYAADSEARLRALEATTDEWWEESVPFFEESRNRAWVMVRRVAHSAHHRGQQMAMLRMLGREVHSNYGPTADTGGLMANQARVTYAYDDIDALIEGEAGGGAKAPLPGPGDKPPTERG